MATTQSGLYYPGLSDAPNGPSQIQQLAQSADAKVIPSFASAAARTAAIVTPTDGQITYRSDTKIYERWSAATSAWVAMPGPLIQSGTGTIALSAAATGTGAVTFPTAFTVAPVVVVSGTSTTAGGLSIAYAIDASTNGGVPTTTGFTVRATFISLTAGTATARYSWSAFGV
jgi:hypothetical protein